MNKKNESVSIIIPVYNETEEYLIQCIESVINQTYNNIEIIIIFDGRDNNSEKICDRYLKKDKRIKVIYKENEGVSKARNIGILEATGKYIMFVDSDDWLELDACQEMVKNLDEDTDMLICNSYINYTEKKKENCICPEKYSLLTEEQIEELSTQIICSRFAKYTPIYANVGTVWGKILKKEFVLKNYLLFHEELKFSEDEVFFLEIFEKKGTYKYLNKALYNYRRNIKSTVNKFTYGLEEEFIKGFYYMYSIAENKSVEFMQLFYVKVIDKIFRILERDYFHPNNKEKKKEKIIRLEKMLNKEIFELALKKCNRKMLTKNIKIKLLLLEHKKYSILHLLTLIKYYKKNKELYKWKNNEPPIGKSGQIIIRILKVEMNKKK